MVVELLLLGRGPSLADEAGSRMSIKLSVLLLSLSEMSKNEIE